MHYEGQDASGEHIVLHVRIPGCPQPLKEVEVHIVLGNVVELAPVGLLGRGEQGQ